MSPSQKLGTDSPRSARALATHSAGRPRRTAATMPAPTPSRVANAMASSDSSIVTGSAVRSIEVTLAPVRIEMPRSPCSAWLTNRQNCTGSDWSSPYCCRIALSVSGVRSSPARARAGSPGRARTPRNTTTVASSSVRADCQARLNRYRRTIFFLPEAREANPDRAVREDLDTLDGVGHTGEVALAVQVDQRVVLVQLLHGLRVELLALGQVLGLTGLGQQRVHRLVVVARDVLAAPGAHEVGDVGVGVDPAGPAQLQQLELTAVLLVEQGGVLHRLDLQVEATVLDHRLQRLGEAQAVGVVGGDHGDRERRLDPCLAQQLLGLGRVVRGALLHLRGAELALRRDRRAGHGVEVVEDDLDQPGTVDGVLERLTDPRVLGL